MITKFVFEDYFKSYTLQSKVRGTADSYLAHNNAGNYVSFFIDGIECARIKKK